MAGMRRRQRMGSSSSTSPSDSTWTACLGSTHLHTQYLLSTYLVVMTGYRTGM